MNAHDFRRLLKEGGWVFLRQSGTSHEIWRKENPDGTWRNERWTPGGIDHNEVSGGLLTELLRRFGLEAIYRGEESPQLKPHRFTEGSKVAREGTFGRRLYDAAKAAGMTQTSIAALVAEELKGAITKNAVQVSLSSWMRGDTSPFKPDTFELKAKKNKLGELPATGPIIGVLAQLFGWNDLMQYRIIKSASQQLVEVETEPEHYETVVTEVHPIPESLPMSKIEALEPEEEKVAALAPKTTKDEKAFVAILKTSDVMQFLIDQDTKIRKLEKENNDLKRRGETSTELLEKARKYDEIQRLLGR